MTPGQSFFIPASALFRKRQLSLAIPALFSYVISQLGAMQLMTK
jgi:hypothetical protein